MRVRVAGAVLGIAAAVVLAGCGSSGNSGGGSAAGGSPTAGGTSGSAQGQGTTVDVKATEFAFSLSKSDFSPGTYTFTMHDDGHATHAMAMEGPGLSNAKSSNAGPGETATMTVTLKAGTYTLYCPVGNHRAQGMQTTLTVK